MPDLATHVLSGFFVIRPRSYRELFFIGLVLPDVLGRFPMLFYKNSYWAIAPGHTPVGVLLASYLVSFLFEPALRRTVFKNLLLGASVHLFLDLLQRHVSPAYYWFFPFSWKTFEIPLFWPDQSIYAVPFIVLALGLFRLLRRRLARARAGSK